MNNSSIKIPSPNAVLTMATEPSGFHLKALQEVSKHLSDPYWVMHLQYGTQDDPYYRITVPGVANGTDKRLIYETLAEAGWHRIKQRNSGEIGETPGMYMVTVYANPNILR